MRWWPPLAHSNEAGPDVAGTTTDPLISHSLRERETHVDAYTGGGRGQPALNIVRLQPSRWRRQARISATASRKRATRHHQPCGARLRSLSASSSPFLAGVDWGDPAHAMDLSAYGGHCAGANGRPQRDRRLWALGLISVGQQRDTGLRPRTRRQQNNQ